MGLRQFFGILLARWWVVLGTAALLVMVAGAYLLLRPRTYVATASVVVDFKQPADAQEVDPTQLTNGYMATQLDILRSQAVALRVVDRLKLADSPTTREAYRSATGGPPAGLRPWLAGLLLRNLDVEFARESRVVNLSYQGADPRFAAALANAFAQSYIEANLDLSTDPARRGADWFEKQLKELRQRLDTAQGNLSAFQRKQGIVATDARLDVGTARLNELNTQLVQVEALRHDAETREAEMRRIRAQGGGLDTLPEAASNTLVQTLKAQLVQAQATLTELSAQLGENHPQYQRARSQVQSLRTQLGAELGKIARGLTESAARARAQEAAIRKELEDQRRNVLDVTQVRDQLPSLEREVASAQQAYDAALARHQQSTLESRISDTNVTILTAAVPPPNPAGPLWWLLLAGAAIIGTALGIGAALLWELLDVPIRSAQDAADSLGLPVLGALQQGHA